MPVRLGCTKAPSAQVHAQPPAACQAPAPPVVCRALADVGSWSSAFPPQEGIQRREIGLANAAGMALLGGLCLYRGCQDADK